MNNKYTCETCRHEISTICIPCDPKDKSKGWEPVLPEEIVDRLLWLKKTRQFNPYEDLEFMKEWYDKRKSK